MTEIFFPYVLGLNELSRCVSKYARKHKKLAFFTRMDDVVIAYYYCEQLGDGIQTACRSKGHIRMDPTTMTLGKSK